MTLSQRIAEVKGWEEHYNNCWINNEKRYVSDYSPETNKAQGMELLIELMANNWTMYNNKQGYDLFDGDCTVINDKDPLIAICKAWLAAFGEG